VSRAGRPSGGSAREPTPTSSKPAYQEPPPQYEAAPEPAPQTDMVQQLKDLAALKDQGILTEEEFAAQKARILGS
jgi:Short C-terminal domain